MISKPKPLRTKGSWRTRKHPLARSTVIRAASQTERSQMIAKGRRLWSKLILSESSLCAVCRARPAHDAMHCFTVGAYPSMQLEPMNGAPGCRVCHRRIDSDHHAKREFFVRYRGAQEYARLELLAQTKHKMDVRLEVLALWTALAAR